MTGFLVVNAYLKSEKFDALHAHLVKAAAERGVELIIKTNEKMLFEKGKTDFVLFWDKDVTLVRLLEKRGLPVFNGARAIELCDDKGKTYIELLGSVPQPETLIAPLSFFDTDYSEFISKAVEKLGLPLVFKERCGSFGEQVYLCNTAEDIKSHINGKPFLLQEYIESSAGEDVRLEVVGGRVIAAMRRKNPDDSALISRTAVLPSRTTRRMPKRKRRLMPARRSGLISAEWIY